MITIRLVFGSSTAGSCIALLKADYKRKKMQLLTLFFPSFVAFEDTNTDMQTQNIDNLLVYIIMVTVSHF